MHGSHAQEPPGPHPDHLHEEISADYADMIYAETAKEIEEWRQGLQAILGKWRMKCWAVADSLEDAGGRLFTFTRLSRSSGATNAVERLHEEFKLKFNSFGGACGREMADFCGFRAAWSENWPEM